MRLGEVIRKWRRSADMSAQTAATEIGIGTATLYRLERGDGVDGSVLAKVLTWLLGAA